MPAENGKYTLALFALAAAASIRFVYQQRFAPIQQPYEYPSPPATRSGRSCPRRKSGSCARSTRKS